MIEYQIMVVNYTKYALMHLKCENKKWTFQEFPWMKAPPRFSFQYERAYATIIKPIGIGKKKKIGFSYTFENRGIRL